MWPNTVLTVRRRAGGKIEIVAPFSADGHCYEEIEHIEGLLRVNNAHMRVCKGRDTSARVRTQKIVVFPPLDVGLWRILDMAPVPFGKEGERQPDCRLQNVSATGEES